MGRNEAKKVAPAIGLKAQSPRDAIARRCELVEIVDADHALEPCHAVDHLLEAVLAEPFAFVMLELLGDPPSSVRHSASLSAR